MKCVVVQTLVMNQQASQRFRFRVRMCDGTFQVETPELSEIYVADEDLDNLVDTLIGTPGVKQVRTRDVPMVSKDVS